MYGGEKFSIKKINRKSIVWLENSPLINKELKNYRAVASYIAQHIGEVYTIIESGQKVYIGKDLPGEYTQSKYTSYLRGRSPQTVKAKNRAVNGLGEMIETATNRQWEKTKHTQNKDARYGMYRYNSSFAFPVKDNMGAITAVRAYDVELLIRNASDGKKYLYDIVGMKRNATAEIGLLERKTRKGGYEASSQRSASNNQYTQGAENVNSESPETAQKKPAGKGGEARYSINRSFKRDIREWYQEGQSGEASFVLGSTGPVLQGLGAIESDIYMNETRSARF